jgi:large subunit ribosomal protein L15
MDLSTLKPAPGSKKKNKRVGRGPGSDHGKTSTRGHKGQKSRSGGSIKPWMEGGQMPLHLRLPKRGFTNIFKEQYQIINLRELKGLPTDEPITVDVLKKHGKIKSINKPVKVLGHGDIDAAVTLQVTACSKTAREKIEAAGGKVEVPSC